MSVVFWLTASTVTTRINSVYAFVSLSLPDQHTLTKEKAGPGLKDSVSCATWYLMYSSMPCCSKICCSFSMLKRTLDETAMVMAFCGLGWKGKSWMLIFKPRDVDLLSHEVQTWTKLKNRKKNVSENWGRRFTKQHVGTFDHIHPYTPAFHTQILR